MVGVGRHGPRRILRRSSDHSHSPSNLLNTRASASSALGTNAAASKLDTPARYDPHASCATRTNCATFGNMSAPHPPCQKPLQRDGEFANL
eukprot:7320373-Pyramimonas_sp.AAC.1